jgi:hypothetical protein
VFGALSVSEPLTDVVELTAYARSVGLQRTLRSALAFELGTEAE